MKHLWEIDHSYYCTESNYFASGDANRSRCQYEYESFEEFLSEWANADNDYNLLFRWDWREISNGEYEDYIEDSGTCDRVPYTGNDKDVTGELLIYFMLQRKGYFVYTRTLIRRCDEQRVLEYLKPKWEHLKSLWEPIG